MNKPDRIPGQAVSRDREALEAFWRPFMPNRRRRLRRDAGSPGIPWRQFAACRANLSGLIPSAIPIFWNIEK